MRHYGNFSFFQLFKLSLSLSHLLLKFFSCSLIWRLSEISSFDVDPYQRADARIRRRRPWCRRCCGFFVVFFFSMVQSSLKWWSGKMFSIVFNRVGWVQKRSSQEHRGGVYTHDGRKKENRKNCWVRGWTKRMRPIYLPWVSFARSLSQDPSLCLSLDPWSGHLSGGTKKLEIGNCTGETNGFHLVYISPIHLPAGHHPVLLTNFSLYYTRYIYLP